MKTINKFLTLLLCAVAIGFASCSEEDNPSIPTQKEIEAKIIGKWKTISLNGIPILTNKRGVMTFYKDKNETMSISRYFDDLGNYVWDNKTPYVWSVEGITVCEQALEGGIAHYKKVVEIGDNHYSYIFTRTVDPQGEKHIRNWNEVAERVTVDYSTDILGLWAGVEMTGDETYGDAHHLIEYKRDGSYTYYSWDEELEQWLPSEDSYDEWNVDGDWLATRWQNHGSQVMNYEWWDIEYIKDGEMKWSALRVRTNGERFETTFTWRKIRDLED